MITRPAQQLADGESIAPRQARLHIEVLSVEE